MYLYNITLIIEPGSTNDVIQQVRSFLMNFQKPADISTINLLEMIDSQHDGATYCLQLQAKNKQAIVEFHEQHLQNWQAHIDQRHEGKVVYFDSIMKYLEQ